MTENGLFSHFKKYNGRVFFNKFKYFYHVKALKKEMKFNIFRRSGKASILDRGTVLVITRKKKFREREG